MQQESQETDNGTAVQAHFLGSLWGKTMNSLLFYHDVMNTLPALPEADKRGLAPPDLFPHK